MKTVGLLSFAFLVALILAGCCGRNIKHNNFIGEVTEIRVLEQTIESQKAAGKSGDAALGAFVGGALTGGLGGAVVGAAVGASSNDAVKINRLTSCRMKVALPDGKDLFLFFDHFNRSAEECALFKRGDKIKIEEMIIDNDPAIYSWKGNFATIGSQ